MPRVKCPVIKLDICYIEKRISAFPSIFSSQLVRDQDRVTILIRLATKLISNRPSSDSNTAALQRNFIAQYGITEFHPIPTASSTIKSVIPAAASELIIAFAPGYRIVERGSLIVESISLVIRSGLNLQSTIAKLKSLYVVDKIGTQSTKAVWNQVLHFEVLQARGASY